VPQQHEHEAGEVEDEYLDRNRPAQRGNLATECSCFVWEGEESVAKEQIEQEAKRCERGDGSPKCFSWKLEIRPADKPPAQRTKWDDEQRQAPCVSEWRRIIRGGLQNRRGE